jgi:recombination protein U
MHRGDSFQSLINIACQQYNDRNIAAIKEISAKQGRDKSGRLYYKPRDSSRTSLDYLGAYKFIPVTFDAKETSETNRFPLKNIEPVQVDIMSKFQRHGVCFLLVNFLRLNKCYRIYYPTVSLYWGQWQAHKGERGYGSIPIEEFISNGDEVSSNNGIVLDFLNNIEIRFKLGLQATGTA